MDPGIRSVGSRSNSLHHDDGHATTKILQLRMADLKDE